MGDQFEDKRIVRECLLQISSVTNTGIISFRGADHPLFRPAMTWIFIHLHDAMKAAQRCGKRCDLRGDDIQEIDDGDLASLVAAARNAACHIDSGRRFARSARIPNAKLVMSWVTSIGKGPVMKHDDIEIINHHDEDILLIFGGVRFYTFHNLAAAYEWLRTHFAPDLPAMIAGAMPTPSD